MTQEPMTDQQTVRDNEILVARWLGWTENHRMNWCRPDGRETIGIPPEYSTSFEAFGSLLMALQDKLHSPRVVDWQSFDPEKPKMWQAEVYRYAGLHSTETRAYSAKAETPQLALLAATVKLIESQNQENSV